jgi:hypothetical protein
MIISTGAVGPLVGSRCCHKSNFILANSATNMYHNFERDSASSIHTCLQNVAINLQGCDSLPGRGRPVTRWLQNRREGSFRCSVSLGIVNPIRITGQAVCWEQVALSPSDVLYSLLRSAAVAWKTKWPIELGSPTPP